MIELIHGDCLEKMKDIPDKSIDLILTDPPYGTTILKWDSVIPFEPMWEQYKRIIKDNGAIVLTASQPFTSALVMSNVKMFKYGWIWEKSKCGSPLTAKFKPMSKHENVLVFGNGRIRYNPQMVDGTPYSRTSKTGVNNMGYGAKSEFVYGSKDGKRHPKTVQFFQQKWRRQDQLHPTQKPVALFEYLIKTYTNEGDLVLDNCMGSGTTGVACKNLNRNFIGIELDENYFNIAKKRIEES